MRGIAAAVDLQSKMTPGNGSSIARKAQSEASPMVRWRPSCVPVYGLDS